VRKTLSILFALVLVLSFSLMATTPVAANPTNWYVDASVAASGDGTSWATAFKTIGEAITAAAGGDNIEVGAGEYRFGWYNEHDKTGVGITKSVTLLGPNAGTPGYEARVDEAVIHIEGQDTGWQGVHGLAIGAPDVTIDGFKIQGEAWKWGFSPVEGAHGLTVQNNIIETGMTLFFSIDDFTYRHNLVQNTDSAELYNRVQHNAIYAELYGGDEAGRNWVIGDNRITDVRSALVLSLPVRYSDITFSRNEVVEPLVMGVNIGGNTIIGNMVISDNTITSAGNSGVYFSTIAVIDGDAAIVVTHNVISAQSHGVFLAAATVGSASEIIVECNAISGPGVGVRVYTPEVAGIVGRIRFNSLSGNSWGVYNDTAVVVDATDNWWGAEDGPGVGGPGSGDKVSTNVLYDPWIKYAVPNTQTGTGPAYFSPSNGNIVGLTPVAAPSLPSVNFPHGMFTFQICCLTPGQTVDVTVTLPSAVPVGTVWWKYHNGQWSSLPNLSDNGDNIMVIRLTDGGSGDLDGVADGFITDPGGPGNPMTVGWDGSPVSRAGVLAPWIALLAAIVAGAGLFVWKRRRVEI
jgi:hypothetical protein